MREELDNILGAISAPYLTANEWCEAALTLNGGTTDKDKYRALFSVLYARGGQGTDIENLHAYFAARGLSKADLSQKQREGFSNIFIGGPLE